MMMILVCLLGLSLSFPAPVSSSARWGYNAGLLPGNWGQQFSDCNSNSQSPIDIERSVMAYKSNLGQITLSGYDVSRSLTLKNNGHSAKAGFENNGNPASVSGGGLVGNYELLQFHFHWGSDDSQGSEHTVETQSAPMELHLVHFKYGSLVNALDKPDGLAVLGFFFEISSSPNANFNKIIDQLKNIPNPNDVATTASLAIRDLLPDDLSEFYRYQGSLTTPPCSEAVVWTVFRKTIPISSGQLAEFRTLFSSEKDSAGQHLHMVDNFRPVQNINGRSIFSNYQTNGKSLVKTGSAYDSGETSVSSET